METQESQFTVITYRWNTSGVQTDSPSSLMYFIPP